MTKKDTFTIAALWIALATAVFGGMAVVDARMDEYVRRSTLEAYMEQVLTRLQSIEEALR